MNQSLHSPLERITKSSAVVMHICHLSFFSLLPLNFVDNYNFIGFCLFLYTAGYSLMFSETPSTKTSN